MAEPLRLFIVAGEPSGDRIGADLISRLRAITPLQLSGVGGTEMVGQGLTSLFPMHDLAVMGLTDVLLRLPLLLWRVEQTARAIVREKPDVTVLIDAQDFSKLVARRVRAMGWRGALVLYVAPTVWARAPERAAKLTPLVDEVLAVLPFEPKAMADLGGPPTVYVGHPALGEVRQHIDLAAGKVALLPGSRNGELRRHLPLLRDVAAKLATEPNVTGLYIPTLPDLLPRLREAIAEWPVQPELIADRAARPALYDQTLMAVSVSGTAVLELAFAGVATLLIYVMDGPQARFYSSVGRPPVGLPNIIVDRAIQPELVMDAPDLASVLAAAQSLARNKQARQDQIAAFGELVNVMRNGTTDAPRQNPADRVLSHWHRA